MALADDYLQQLATYRATHTQFDDPAELARLAPLQQAWMAANPGAGDNPTGALYDPKAPTNPPPGAVSYANGSWLDGTGQNVDFTTSSGANPQGGILPGQATYTAADFAQAITRAGKTQLTAQQMADLANRAGSDPAALKQLVGIDSRFTGVLATKLGQGNFNQLINQASYAGAAGTMSDATTGVTQALQQFGYDANGNSFSAPWMKGIVAGHPATPTTTTPSTTPPPSTPSTPSGSTPAAPTAVGQSDWEKQLRSNYMNSNEYNPGGANTWGIQNSPISMLQDSFGGTIGGNAAPGSTPADFSNQANQAFGSNSGYNPQIGAQQTSAPNAFGGVVQDFNNTASQSPTGTQPMPTTSTTGTAPTPTAPTTTSPSYFGGAVPAPTSPTTSTSLMGVKAPTTYSFGGQTYNLK